MYTTNYNRDYVATTNAEANGSPSMTVPDQTLSLGELLARFTRGENVPTLSMNFQDEDDDNDFDVSQMDLSEVQELTDALADRRFELEEEMRVNTPPSPPPAAIAEPEDPETTSTESP